MIFGEKHRELFETKGEELIELGIKNGKNWSDAKILKDNRLSSYFEMAKKGIIKKDDADKLENQLPLYFTDKEISILKNGEDVDNKHFGYEKGVGEYIKLFENKISESDTNIVSPTPFDHFKQYIIYDKYKLTLFGEGGLQLDSYKKKNLKYYQEEGELCYMIEDIALKYHYFGMLLRKDIELELWIEKIKNNLKESSNYWLTSALIQVIYKLCNNESDADKIIIDIQNHAGVDTESSGFITHNQVTERLSKIK